MAAPFTEYKEKWEIEASKGPKRGTLQTEDLSVTGVRGVQHRKTGLGIETLGLASLKKSWKDSPGGQRTKSATQSGSEGDLEKLHRLIKEQAGQIDDLTKQVTGLKAKLENAQATNSEVSTFLNSDIVGKEQQARKLSEVLDQRTKAFERASGRLKEQMERMLRDQKAEFDAIELNLRREVAELKEDNKQLLHFRGRQEQMDRLVESLRIEAKGLKEDIESQDFSWHQKFASTKAALESEYGTALETAKEVARTEARDELAKEVLAQQKEKVQISKDLEEQKRIREGYLRERKHLRDECAQYRTDKSLSAQQLQEQQQQLAQIHKHNAELFHVCKALKMKMDALLQELEQSRGSIVATVPMFEEPNKENLAADLANELAQRQTVLKSAKRIARTLLMQRADLESFLTDSIQVCRDQIVAEQKQKKKNERMAMLQGSSGQDAKVSESQSVQRDDMVTQESHAASSRAQPAAHHSQDPSDSGAPEDAEVQDGSAEAQSAGLSMFKSVPISKLSWRQRELLLKMIFKKANEHQKDISTARSKLKHAIRVL
eukprot:gnl/MRDRNA2_/MRDRNA2_94788_c0_seq1.p1 gnl/MRDRNA2_/MRDRNA2_94788_c0~~gnl/MRDRNA2_/MRDRNA2_94788_c0_seq1.p1  ORF type:complete len:571 (+),score=156.23 gnl/MRDRNA2_/MRDRNA2_94788_c0_seq1:73-1713(+)